MLAPTPLEGALQKMLGSSNLKRIQSTTVAIGGCGGLGSNCAWNLARVGFRRFYLYDFDVVEPSNLNRQFFFADQIGQNKQEALKHNLLRINSNIEVMGGVTRVTEENVRELFDPADIVVEAFDRAEAKALLAEEYITDPRFFVSASGLAGWGGSNDIKLKRVHKSFVLIGDGVTGVSGANPPLSPRVSIASAMEANAVLSYVLGGEEFPSF